PAIANDILKPDQDEGAYARTPVAAALSATRSKNTYLAAKYRRITARAGRNKALVAVEHSILNAAWHMLRNGEIYNDPGADHYNRISPTRAKNKAIKQLNNLGYDVTITPVTAA
ncbi:hypothetical protein ACKLTP_07775, partial [Paenarthrobacter ureafaciens]